MAESTERALKTQLRSAEQAARGLKEEMGRMRVLVAQNRAACANEVRKRERVIEGLKKHVGEGGRARGSGKAVGVATVVVVPGVGAEDAGKVISTNESGYDLRMETNEFLTELARGLSAENENLGALVKKTVETLRSLSGCEKEVGLEGDMVVEMDGGYENIAGEMDGVIDHLRTLLTNPSFVPLEEVEVREDEIIRLREGWEKMEGRWREAVQMMDGWRKRMAKSGQTVNLEELKMGLSLSPLKEAGEGETSGATGDDVEQNDEGDTQADIDAMDDSQVPVALEAAPEMNEDSDNDSDFSEDQVEELEQEKPQEQVLEAASSPGSPPQLSPLRETANKANRSTQFTTIVEEDTWDLAHLNGSSSNTENVAPASEDLSPIKPTSHNPSPRKISNNSRLPRPAFSLPQQSPLTMASIAAKLAATEREADAARVRAKLKAAKLSSAASTVLKAPLTSNDDYREPVKANGEEPISRKRKASGKLQCSKVSRRRSTLSPWELESLILGGAGLSPAKGD